MLFSQEPPEQKIVLRERYPLNPGQLRAVEVAAGPQTHLGLIGGSRSGKTALITRWMVKRALWADDTRHLFVRHRANALRSSLWLDTLPKVMRMWFPGVKLKPYRSDGFEELPNGSQLWMGGLDDEKRVEKILGQEYASVFAGEVSQTPFSSIMILRTRLAQSGTGLRLRAFYDLNPTSTQHWSHLEFIQKRSPLDKTLLPDPENYQHCFINPEDNAANLDASYLQSLRNMPKLYRDRFYEGKYVTAIEGALWTADGLELCREDQILPDPAGKKLKDFTRIVVGVDPSGAQSKMDIKSDEIGIVVAGKKHGNTASVLEDASIRGGPKEWGTRVVATYKKWKADSVVAEANYGGEMVRSTIQAIDGNVPVKLVNATRGKVVRAEPVAALYDMNKVKLAGRFPEMEDQMTLFAREGYKGSRSPDRADAKIWAVTELMLGEQSGYTLAHVR